MTLQLNLRAVVYSLSDALDLVGIDELYHGKRVAYMAVECARHLGIQGDELENLFHAAILHDCGVSSTRVHHELVSQMEWDGSQVHCERGAMLLRRCPLLSHLAEVIRYHHTHWQQLRSLSLKPTEALHSNLIFMADRIDALVSQHTNDNLLLVKGDIRDVINALRDDMFAPHLVDAFLAVSDSEAFWFRLEDTLLKQHLNEWTGDTTLETIDFPTLKSLAEIFSNIVDAKSLFTAEHSEGVANLARYAGNLFELPEKNCDMLEIAGLLHDLGKLRVPDEILDKPQALDAQEFAIMERHSFDSFVILGKIKGFEEIARWASLHHETPSGKGYPFHLKKSELPLEARILAVVDVFQALAQDRPYRVAMTPTEIFSTLEEMAGAGRLDGDVVAKLGGHLEKCWEVAVGKKIEA
ncbi:HD domain-containing phosphohydrolase [Pseudomonadota bacterium]